jgi:hypothetical protein
MVVLIKFTIALSAFVSKAAFTSLVFAFNAIASAFSETNVANVLSPLSALPPSILSKRASKSVILLSAVDTFPSTVYKRVSIAFTSEEVAVVPSIASKRSFKVS